ncbi:MAG: 23S rRNA pseudouridine(2604) synthase RluF [Balneolia bacterium]|nr:23S rRNA pseudouridine(2604) synthase RluF [Balneolia bacterium]
MTDRYFNFPKFKSKFIVLVRLNKFISEAGICSRREADRKIEKGQVRVNGKVAQIGDLVSKSDRVLVSGNPVEMRDQYVYLAYNKPVGVTSTTDRTDPDNILKAVGYHGGRVFPVGRLDKDSEGLILLTNDGDIVNKILRASNKHDKEYIVTVDKPVTPDFITQMSEGVSILGVMTRKCMVEQINPRTIRMILNQGLNRQIRRMCEALGYQVTSLQRVRVMNINLDGIATGTWRFLTESEQDTLLKAVEGSSKEASTRKKNRSGAVDEADSAKSAQGKSGRGRNRSGAKKAAGKRDTKKGAPKTSAGRNTGSTAAAPKSGRSKNTRNASKPAKKSTSKSKGKGTRRKK